MKQKFYLLLVPFLFLSLFGSSQRLSGKGAKPFFGKMAIRKKISDLRSAAREQRKEPDTTTIKPMRSYFKKYHYNAQQNEEGFELGTTPHHTDQEEEDDGRMAAGERASATASSTQQVWSNFLGLDFYDNRTGWPPDPGGAAGSKQVIALSNLGLRVFNKPSVTDVPLVSPTGYSRQMPKSSLFVTLENFFSPVLPYNSGITDPHIRYDRLSKRWFIIAIEVNPEQQNNLVFLAVSDGDEINESSWFSYYSFNSSLFPYNPAAPYAPFLDYPTLGTDRYSVLIGGNQFGYDSLTNVGYVIDKKKLLKGQLVVYPFDLGVANNITGTVKGMYTPQAAYNDDPAAKKSFFAGISYYQNGLVLAGIEYDKNNTPVLSRQYDISTQPWNNPRDNSSPGGLVSIDMLDTRLLGAHIYKNKMTGAISLWTAHAIGVNQKGGLMVGSDSDFVREARTASRWYTVKDMYTNPFLFQTGTVYDGLQPSGRRAVQYFNPSIAVNGQGHSIVSGTVDAFNQYLNVFAAGRYYTDEKGKTKPVVKVTNTTAIYAPYQSNASNDKTYIGRWGDFSQTVVDPVDDQTIWTFQEYADVDDSYGLRVVQFKAPPPAKPAALGKLSNKTDTTITLHGEVEENSGFFDPGKDVGGPGYNRLSVKSTGNVGVSNIKFVSPTEISFTLNIKNKPAGQYILIITNPDGQVVVTTYSIDANKSVSNNRIMPDSAMPKAITGSEVFPNPTVGNVILKLNGTTDQMAKVVLVDVDGKQVFAKNYAFAKGSGQAELPTQNFIRGTYIALVYNAENVLIATQKIVKQ